MKLAIMQPYVFPYIGYFQMINAVDIFVFYDDVNYLKNGWINRNRILVNGNEKLFTLPLKEASSFRLIKEIEVNSGLPVYKKILTTMEQNYRKAPYFSSVFPIIEDVFRADHATIADNAIHSIEAINKYLGMTTTLKRSSVEFSGTKGMDRAERLIEIGKLTGAKEYINAIGGQELYTKEYFASEGIDLKFIKPKPIEYKQFNNEFVPWLSMIDVIMFNSIEDIKLMLNNYILL